MFRVISRRPSQDYGYSVVDRVAEIPAFDAISKDDAPSTRDECAALVNMAKTVYNAETESDVQKVVNDVRGALAKGVCDGNVAAIKEIDGYLAQTVFVLPDSYRVRAGHELVLTVSRDNEGTKLTWVLIVQGGERGKWLTTYGAMFSPNRDQKFFSDAAADDMFEIKKETNRDQLKVVPAVFFTWIARGQQDRNISHGPTGGIGVRNDSPAVFLGYSATFNWNLGVVGGVAALRETRLHGKYSEGESIAESLDSEQLNSNTTHLRWFFGVTFRFGTNPFASEESNEQEAEEPPDTSTGDQADEEAGAGENPQGAKPDPPVK